MTQDFVYDLGELVGGRIIRRYKRFLADVELATGERITAHCPNTGSMRGCWEAGAPVELTIHDRPTRKLKYTLERVDMGAGWVGVNTSVVNHVIAGALRAGVIGPLAGYSDIATEPAYLAPGFPRSRFDLKLTADRRPDAFVEIKNTTLLAGDAVTFPDAVTERGRKHLELLAHAARAGYRAVIVFAVNRPEGNRFEPAADIDPAYARTLEKVVDRGVEALAVRLKHVDRGITIAGAWPGHANR